MYRQLGGDGLIAFSDPAGAKAGLALATILLKLDATRSVRLFSNRRYPFYAHWPLPVTIAEASPDAPSDWLFTGTSHPETSGGFELRAIAAALARNVPSWAFVDHWTGMALRFASASGPVLPDHIVVTDQQAADAAIAEGLPTQRLVVHRNPYLDFIAGHWRPRLGRSEVLRRLGLPDEAGPLILYAPDPISLRNADHCWGFDEGSALADLVAAAPPGAQLLVKSHPLQPPGALDGAVRQAARTGVALHVAGEAVDPLELMHAADLVVGMHSNFLLEAAALGRPILRYFPASAEKDAIAHLDVGTKVLSRQELGAALARAFGIVKPA